MDVKIRDQLLKIKRLRDEGYAGEAKAAANLLDKLLKKHGVPIEELCEDQKESMIWLRYKNDSEKFLIYQIVAYICESTNKEFWRQKGKNGVIGVNATKIQQIDIEMFYAHYKPILNSEFKKLTKQFRRAFSNKYCLCLPHDESEETKSNDLTFKELQALLGMMAGMKDDSGPRKQIEGRSAGRG